MKCPKCGTSNRDSAKFCKKCGNALFAPVPPTVPEQRLCAMGHVQDPTWTECPYCKQAAGAAVKPGMQPTVPPRDELEGRSRDPKKGRTVVYEQDERPLAGWLVVLAGRGEPLYRDFRLHEGKNTLGRSGSQDVSVADEGISAEHAILVIKDGQYRLTDLGAANGTFVNGQKVETATLSDGDEIKCGRTALVLKTFTRRAG
ncbi:MAG: FHA domain-containing protein [Deltaproteobacteria bacterium]|nr:FHA domain-containing protein [Deltaproteobacteria bacterium]